MYNNFDPKLFLRHDQDSFAIRWYLRRVFASKQIDINSKTALSTYFNVLDSYKKEQGIVSEEMDMQHWQNFAVLFAKKNGVGNGYSPVIMENIEKIIKARRGELDQPADSSNLEKLTDDIFTSTARITPPTRSEIDMDYAVGLIPLLSNSQQSL